MAKTLAVIEACDPGCEGPGEAYLRWLLASVLPPEEVITQYEVWIEGRQYFLDAAIPGIRCGFEFDGYSKVDVTSEGRRDFVDRQNSLLRAGWKLMRISSREFARPVAALRKVAAHVGSCGCPVNGPKRSLWKKLPSGFFVPDRRF